MVPFQRSEHMYMQVLVSCCFNKVVIADDKIEQVCGHYWRIAVYECIILRIIAMTVRINRNQITV